MKQLSATALSGGNWTIKMTPANGLVGDKVVGQQSTLSDMLASIRARHPTLAFSSRDEAAGVLAAEQMAKLAGLR